MADGYSATEQPAYQMELGVYFPACYPNDLDPSAFEELRQEIERDATP